MFDLKKEVIVTVGVFAKNIDSAKKCLNSLESQNIQNSEVFVFDFCESKKDRREIKRIATCFKFVYKKCKGKKIFDIKNELLQKAKGDFLYFAGDDICFLNEGLKKMIETAQQNNADIVIAKAAEYEFDGKRYPADWTVRQNAQNGKKVFRAEDLGDELFLFCKFWSGDKLFRREFLIKNSLNFPSQKSFESVPFVVNALLCGKITVSDTPIIFTCQKSRAKYSFNPIQNADTMFETIKAVKDKLAEKQVYEKYKRSFLSWSIMFCVWNFETANIELQPLIRNVIKNKVEPLLNIGEKRLDYYMTRVRCLKYCELCSEDDYDRAMERLRAFEIKPTIVSIWGSCVSREFFNLDLSSFFINGYVFQCPPNIFYNNFSVNEKIIPMKILAESETTPFWQRSAYINFNHLAKEHLKYHKSDFLIVDCADMRFSWYLEVLRKDGAKAKIIVGKQIGKCFEKCQEYGLVDKNSTKEKHWFAGERYLLEESQLIEMIDLFVEDLLQLYPAERIILNETVFAESYSNGEFLKPFDCNNRRYIKVIKIAEKRMRERLQGCHYISAVKNAYSIENHNLGLLNLHYCKTADEYKLEAIKKIIFENADSSTLEILRQKYDEKLAEEMRSLKNEVLV